MNKRQQSAYKSILKAGRMTEFVRRVTVEDDLTGEITQTEQKQTLPCVVLPDGAPMTNLGVTNNGVTPGSMVGKKTRKCIAGVSADSFDIATGDTMKWTDGDWTILGATPLDLDGDGIIIWQFGVSR